MYNEFNLKRGTQMQEKIKITLSLDKQTLNLLDSYVEKHYLDSKSQAIRVLVKKDAEQEPKTNK